MVAKNPAEPGGVALGGGGLGVGTLRFPWTPCSQFCCCQETHTNPWENMNLQASLVHGGSHLPKKSGWQGKQRRFEGNWKFLGLLNTNLTTTNDRVAPFLGTWTFTGTRTFKRLRDWNHRNLNLPSKTSLFLQHPRPEPSQPNFQHVQSRLSCHKKKPTMERCGICETECNNSEHLIKQANKNMKKMAYPPFRQEVSNIN